MTIIRPSGIFVVSLLSIAILAGCNKKVEAPVKPTYDAVPAAPAAVKPAIAANSIPYFSENLDEAKRIWTACVAKGADGMQEAERQTCSNAQAAWEMQPYKAKK